jgi:hypothetical protein
MSVKISTVRDVDDVGIPAVARMSEGRYLSYEQKVKADRVTPSVRRKERRTCLPTHRNWLLDCAICIPTSKS